VDKTIPVIMAECGNNDLPRNSNLQEPQAR
jgi:hypothetical protein